MVMRRGVPAAWEVAQAVLTYPDSQLNRCDLPTANQLAFRHLRRGNDG